MYAGDGDTAARAASLATPGVRPGPAPADGGPARDYLRADSIYVAHAATGLMLGAIQAYRQVLRRHPSFIDAPRARLNIALAYRAMGFEPELRATAKAAEGTETGTLLRALVGDVALEAGALERARTDYAAIAAEGPLGACLEVRGRLALALEGFEGAVVPAASAELEKRCPRVLLDDPETQLLLARVRLDAGDLDGATALLAGLRERVSARSQARVIATQGALAESAGDLDAARAAYEELAAGAYGARAAQSAAARLALLDAADGELEAGLRRLAGLEPSSSEEVRRLLILRALADLEGPTSASEAIALVHESDVASETLPLEAQIQLARAYSHLGFDARAASVLQEARRTAGAKPPAILWEESAQIAQAHGGWPAAMTIADAWAASDSSAPRAMALRARALAGVGKPRAAVEALASAVTALEASEVRDLRIEIGTLLRAHDPKTAQRLLEEAATADVAPALSPMRAATLLWELADLAEANGDDATARAVFAQLAQRYPKEPAASSAAYRHARLEARVDPTGAYDAAASAGGGLERRVAEAAREFEAIVATLGPKEVP